MEECSNASRGCPESAVSGHLCHGIGEQNGPNQ
ncbi:uncharacterized protein METZ01_LOCUS131173 [marine metagenome]|uniref:Uncharacterized protein n=1 Tax=marine metagenome TaxID=408172 RepID=A0A381YMX9_9ZZZZ